MKKAVFLDRDGTINVDKDYLYRIEDFEFLPGAVEGLRKFKEAGYILVVVTNQSGIGRGFYTEEDYAKLEKWFLNEMDSLGAPVSAIYHCPHLPDAPIERYRMECDCRKPALGMFERAIKELDIDVDASVAIGDKERDLAVCKKYPGVKGFKVYSSAEEEKDNMWFVKGGIDDVALRMIK